MDLRHHPVAATIALDVIAGALLYAGATLAAAFIALVALLVGLLALLDPQDSGVHRDARRRNPTTRGGYR